MAHLAPPAEDVSMDRGELLRHGGLLRERGVQRIGELVDAALQHRGLLAALGHGSLGVKVLVGAGAAPRRHSGRPALRRLRRRGFALAPDVRQDVRAPLDKARVTERPALGLELAEAVLVELPDERREVGVLVEARDDLLLQRRVCARSVRAQWQRNMGRRRLALSCTVNAFTRPAGAPDTCTLTFVFQPIA